MKHVLRHLSKLATCLLALSLIALPVTASAQDDGVERLRQALANLDSLSAGFEQTVLDSEFTVDEVSSGTVEIKRPGRFRWDYTEPYEQLIVADGERMWIYEADLEQATVQSMDETLASSPAMLLTGSADLDEGFHLEDEGRQGRLYWVRLVPRVQDSEFESVRIGIGEQTIELMELRDNIGQTTRIEFHSIELNPPIDDGRFQFSPPEGTDVIER